MREADVTPCTSILLSESSELMQRWINGKWGQTRLSPRSPAFHGISSNKKTRKADRDPPYDNNRPAGYADAARRRYCYPRQVRGGIDSPRGTAQRIPPSGSRSPRRQGAASPGPVRQTGGEMSLSNFYDNRILPYAIDWACGLPTFERGREQVCSRAGGRVLEVGIGTGRNLRYYKPENLTCLCGVDPGLHPKAHKRASPRRAG